MNILAENYKAGALSLLRSDLGFRGEHSEESHVNGAMGSWDNWRFGGRIPQVSVHSILGLKHFQLFLSSLTPPRVLPCSP